MFRFRFFFSGTGDDRIVGGTTQPTCADARIWTPIPSFECVGCSRKGCGEELRVKRSKTSGSSTNKAATKRGQTRALVLGREALRTQAWAKAYAQLSTADATVPLAAEELAGLATAAQLIGKEAEAAELLARAHRAFLATGKTLRAARCAFWLGHTALFRGDHAQANGWLARCRRELDGKAECVEHGYLLLPDGLRAVQTGDAAKAHKVFALAAAIGQRFGEKDLAALALHGQGRALIRLGEIEQGVTLLDEAMVAVRSGEVGPITMGVVYCSVLESCHETFDLGRAREWTSALTEWCASQPEMVPFRGACMLHRAEILQLRGAWSEALVEAERAREQLSQPPPKATVGGAFYRLGELHRLRGEFAEAEKAYLRAQQWERTPEPGIAQLRLVQGRLRESHTAIRNIADAVKGGEARVRVLDAYVEIALAAGDLIAARSAADELERTAARTGATYLQALASRAIGAVLLAESEPRAALNSLRLSCKLWCELEAEYDAARVRVLIAGASRRLGDVDNAERSSGILCVNGRPLRERMKAPAILHRLGDID
jgi:tetratricopeptide (TPR) repeat protein